MSPWLLALYNVRVITCKVSLVSMLKLRMRVIMIQSPSKDFGLRIPIYILQTCSRLCWVFLKNLRPNASISSTLLGGGAETQIDIFLLVYYSLHLSREMTSSFKIDPSSVEILILLEILGDQHLVR